MKQIIAIVTMHSVSCYNYIKLILTLKLNFHKFLVFIRCTKVLYKLIPGVVLYKFYFGIYLTRKNDMKALNITERLLLFFMKKAVIGSKSF